MPLYAAVLCLLQPAQPIPVPPPATLENVRPVTVPAFESDRGIRWSSTREEYEAARADPHWAAPTTAITSYAFAAVFYFVCCYGMSRYARSVEARLARAGRR